MADLDCIKIRSALSEEAGAIPAYAKMFIVHGEFSPGAISISRAF